MMNALECDRRPEPLRATVAVCSPRERFLLPGFVDARYKLCEESQRRGIRTLIIERDTIYVGQGRSEISRQIAASETFTHALFLDADSCPHEATLDALIQWDVDVVSALYFMRSTAADPVAYVRQEGGELCGEYRSVRNEVGAFLNGQSIPPLWCPIMLEDPQEGNPRYPLLEVDVVGAGCLLVKKQVLQSCSNWLMEDRGEDIAWCERVRAAGFKVWLDLGTICAHLGLVPLSTGWFALSGQELRQKVEARLAGEPPEADPLPAGAELEQQVREALRTGRNGGGRK